MAVVNRKNIEKILLDIDENFHLYNHGHQMEILYHLEKQKRLYNGEELP